MGAIDTCDVTFVKMVRNGLQCLLNPFEFIITFCDIRYDLARDLSEIGVKIDTGPTSIFVKVGVYKQKLRHTPMDEAATDCVLQLLLQTVPMMEIKEAVADELLPPSILDRIARIPYVVDPLEL